VFQFEVFGDGSVGGGELVFCGCAIIATAVSLKSVVRKRREVSELPVDQEFRAQRDLVA
jgi:hypothetical protein